MKVLVRLAASAAVAVAAPCLSEMSRPLALGACCLVGCLVVAAGCLRAR